MSDPLRIPARGTVVDDRRVVTPEWLIFFDKLVTELQTLVTAAATETDAGDVTPGAVGSGDVIGPSGAGANRIAVFDGITGKIIMDGGNTIADILNLAAAAAGNVTGPASATDDHIATFDGTTGELIQDGGSSIADVIAAALAAAIAAIIPVDLASEVTGNLPFANLEPASAASRLLGRRSGSAGDFEEITLGAGLLMSAQVLSATGSGGSWRPLSFGVEPMALVSDGMGTPVMVAF